MMITSCIDNGDPSDPVPAKMPLPKQDAVRQGVRWPALKKGISMLYMRVVQGAEQALQ